MTTNYPAHSPVSLDRLHQISEILGKAVAQSDGGNLGYAMADAVKVIDGAIAAFGAEPVSVNDDMAYAFHHALSDSSLGTDEVEEIKTGLRAAFANTTTTPAPVVPDTLPCPVHLEPGLKFGKGVRTQCMLDALRRRADYYAELETMTPEQRAEHDSGIAEFKAMLGSAHGKSDDEIGSWNNHVNTPTAQAGNSPVTPDGWVMVPKKLTAENGAKAALLGEFNLEYTLTCHECFGEGCDDCSGEGTWLNTIPVDWTTIKDIWAKAIDHFAAAPQQEVKP